MPGTTVQGTAGLGEGVQFLHAASEDVRVAALEADHRFALLGVLDQRVVDGLLGHVPAVRDLRRVDHLDVGRQFGEEVARAEAVGDDDVGLGEQTAPAHGDEVRVAGSAADEGDARGAGAEVRGDEGAVAQPLDHGVAHGRGVPGVAAAGVGGEHGDGDALAVAGRRGPGGGPVGVVGADAPDAVRLRLGGGGGVGVGVAGGDQRVPGVGEVALGVGAAVPGDLTGVRHRLHGGGGLRRHEVDVGARLDQGGKTPLGDLAAAEDDDPASGEAEAYGVGRVFGHQLGLLGRSDGSAGTLRRRSGPDVAFYARGWRGWGGSGEWDGSHRPRCAGLRGATHGRPRPPVVDGGGRGRPSPTSPSRPPSRTWRPRAWRGPCSGPAGARAARPCPRRAAGRGRPAGAGPAC